MVDIYTPPSISGYNSSPPSDDGSNTSANEVLWATHKNKLGDPLKTYADAINTAVNTSFGKVFGNAVVSISSNTNLATTHQGQHIRTSGAITLTLLAGGTAGSNFVFSFYNNDASNNLTLGRNSMNINGSAANLTIYPKTGGLAFCDGTDWWVTYYPVLDEDTMSSDSATSVPTQQSVKAYVDNNAYSVTLATEQATTSGTAKDFTGIPSGTKRITVMFKGVSTNGTNDFLIQIGDSGGIETSGYASSAGRITGSPAVSDSTAGFILTSTISASNVHSGEVILSLEDASDFTWTITGSLERGGGGVFIPAGSKSLSAELTQLRFTTTGTPDTFDAGVINISYE